MLGTVIPNGSGRATARDLVGSPERSEKYAGPAWPRPAISHCLEKAKRAWFSFRITRRGGRQPHKLAMQRMLQGVSFNGKQTFLLFQESLKC